MIGVSDVDMISLFISCVTKFSLNFYRPCHISLLHEYFIETWHESYFFFVGILNAEDLQYINFHSILLNRKLSSFPLMLPTRKINLAVCD
jgi:hypothetical protein